MFGLAKDRERARSEELWLLVAICMIFYSA